jgi:pSer/pThr/pTyr-binding forkhead associated (FHA) protein
MTGIATSHNIRLRAIASDGQPLNGVETEELVFAAPTVEGYTFGRSDTNSSYHPDIDLEVWNAQQHGISRRHAVLLRYQNVVHLMDLGSMNGTFVNRKRLSPYTPYPLDDGDIIGLANLQIRVNSFEDA